MSDSMIALALYDAAKNCTRDSATAVLTLRSGVKISGQLEAPKGGATTAHIKTDGGGWATVLLEEIAAVEARRG